MKNVVILGAGGNYISKCRIIEGDVMDYNTLKEVINGQDIVYANLSGDLEAMAKNIVNAMKETGVKKLILISSIGIYDTPLKPVFIDLNPGLAFCHRPILH